MGQLGFSSDKKVFYVIILLYGKGMGEWKNQKYFLQRKLHQRVL